MISKDFTIKEPMDDILKWCETHFGPGEFSYVLGKGQMWSIYRYTMWNMYRVNFAREEDFLMFSLRWV